MVCVNRFMLLGRGIAGLGAGILQGTIQVILADLIPARRRGVWLGMNRFI